MKVPKTLLGAMAIGLAFAATTSCTSTRQTKGEKQVKENVKCDAPSEDAHSNKADNPRKDPCPACGRG